MGTLLELHKNVFLKVKHVWPSEVKAKKKQIFINTPISVRLNSVDILNY